MAKNKQEPVKKEKMYTFQEMCQILQVDRRTLLEWVQYHKIPYVRVNEELVRFRMSDIEKWVVEKHKSNSSKFHIK